MIQRYFISCLIIHLIDFSWQMAPGTPRRLLNTMPSRRTFTKARVQQ